MTTPEQPKWEPDPKTMGNWTAMFETKRQGGTPPDAAPALKSADLPSEASPDDEALALDLTVYRPWIVQRGRSRPAMMLDFRRYEPRSGMWSGWAIAYPCLVGMEYTGDTLLSLDFGKCQIVIEGTGLDELVRFLQQGIVLIVQEYNDKAWAGRGSNGCITSIQRIMPSIEQRC